MADIVGPDDVSTRAEVLAIWNAAPERFRSAIALGSTGLRIGEVLGLTVGRVDLEQRLVTVDRQMQRIGNVNQLTTPKGEKVRTIRIPSAVALELRSHLRESPSPGLLFSGARTEHGMRRGQFYASAWAPGTDRTRTRDERFKFHSLRHFAGSAMLAEV